MIQEDARTLKRSNIIPIKNTITENHQYSLKQSFFTLLRVHHQMIL